MDPQHVSFLNPDPKGAKYLQKIEKKGLISKPKYELFKKVIQICSSLNSSSFGIKKKQKKFK